MLLEMLLFCLKVYLGLVILAVCYVIVTECNLQHHLAVSLLFWAMLYAPRLFEMTEGMKVYFILLMFVAGLFIIFSIASHVGWSMTITSFYYLSWTLAFLLSLEINVQQNFSLSVILSESYTVWTLGEMLWVVGWVLVVLFTALFIFSYFMNNWSGMRRK